MTPFATAATLDAGQATTAAFADVEFIDPESGGKTTYLRALTSAPIGFHLVNLSANAAQYRVLGTNDMALADSQHVTLVAATDLAGLAAAETGTELSRLLYYKLQIIDKVGGTHTNVRAIAAARRV